MILQYLPDLLVILIIFTVGVASPGPATLMILGTAMSSGRSSAVALSSGIVVGSLFWGIFAALGLVSALKVSAGLFTALKIVGALYLLFLAFRSFRLSLTSGEQFQVNSGSTPDFRGCFIKGLLLHLTNPKAPLVWLATLTVGLGKSAPMVFLVTAVGLCGLVSITIFFGYAFLFSTSAMSKLYLSIRRPFDALIGLLFSAAAVKILTSRSV